MAKRCGCENDLRKARAALDEAAKAIAELAKVKPAIRAQKPGAGISRPSVPSPVPRPVPVYPTGHHAKDVANLEKAIMKAGEGGVVLLKAKDKSGKKRHFDLTSVTDLSLPFEVSLKSEKDACIRFSD